MNANLKRLLFAVPLAGCLAVAACASPEATRTRGGGRGSDPGNRPAKVKMHEGSNQYWETPRRVGEERSSLAPAQHAKQAEER